MRNINLEIKADMDKANKRINKSLKLQQLLAASHNFKLTDKAKFDLVIIGAGSSGLFFAALIALLVNYPDLPFLYRPYVEPTVAARWAAAFQACRQLKQLKILLLEQTDCPGQKLALTGGGRCNISHLADLDELLDAYFEQAKFMYPALQNLSPQLLRSILYSMEIPTLISENQRIYPQSDSATYVRDQLLAYSLSNPNCYLSTQTKVRQISKTADNKYLLRLSGPDTNLEIRTDRLLLAAGGLSYPHTGSNGSLYKTLQHDLNLPFTPTFKPALAALICTERQKQSVQLLRELSGISLKQAELSLTYADGDGQVNAKERKKRLSSLNPTFVSGELLLTHQGLSGPIALNLARYLSNEAQKNVLTLKFLAAPELVNLQTKWGKLQANIKQTKSNTFFKNWLKAESRLPERLLTALLQAWQIPLQISLQSALQLKAAAPQNLFTLTINGWKAATLASAQVTNGGLSLKAVKPQTLALKTEPKIQVIGELLDIDGACGGYNLHMCFATATTALLALAKDLT